MKKNISTTEALLDQNKLIDKMLIDEALQFLVNDQFLAVEAVNKVLDQLKNVILMIEEKLKKFNDGRLIYVGAGTSGRIGYQDGVELKPTFSWPKSRLALVIAGGDSALTNSIENAEDSRDEAKKIVKNLEVSYKDCVIGLAASGTTQFTLAFLSMAKLQNATTVGIGNNFYGKIHKLYDYGILLDTGGEVLAGSTRLKAGTSQKICLNLISTMLMTRLGRVKNGRMSHLNVSNKKLRQRFEEIKKFI
jgi:N-acetylmuramic acid 6-phosphate etherase